MACDASPNSLVSSLEKWNEAKSAGNDALAAPYEKEIANKLQQEYSLLSSQALSSDPNRINEMRQKINDDLAARAASCNMPQMELVDDAGGLRIITAQQKGFSVTIDETQANSHGADKAVSHTAPPEEKVRAAVVHKPIPRYEPGDRPIAGNDKLPQSQLHPSMERDYYNNMIYKYNDGSKVKFDQAQPPRVSELINARGERISFTYRGESKSPNGFIKTDRNGSVMESGFKGIRDREWSINTEHASWKVKDVFHGAHITDIGITDDLQLCMRDKSGNFIEERRDGDVLKRDARGRITTEVTIVGRTTSFAYRGKETTPSSYSVEDGGGAIIEHGERKKDSWNIYRPKQGTTTLHPDRLTEEANLVKNPVDKVSSLKINHINGDAVMMHPNGDRTWRPGDDERLWRRTTGGAQTVVHPRDNGKPEMQHFVSTDGVKTRYEYDQNGQVLKFTQHHPNGEVHKLTRKDVSQDFVDENGKRQRIESTHLADGSVRMNWMERNSAIIQRPDGAEVHEFTAKDGRKRVHSTVDTRGTRTEFMYNTTTGEPIRLTITNAKGNTDVWQIESPINTGLDNPVWKNKDGSKYFEGVVSVERDGSVKFSAKDGRQTIRTLRGVSLDVTPEPTIRK
ncbi:MAG: hypothetical protein C0469_11815 [Cyanobacteria bacterium DS2.3.42]|nr:hypothetical protein [Cyanobacteria bacterium DS2.3.42]